MESRQLEERVKELEAELRIARNEFDFMVSALEDYYVKAMHSDCIPMEGTTVSLDALDEWCAAYSNLRIVGANDYLKSVGIRSNTAMASSVTFQDSKILARKLWAYVSSYMNGGHDYLFEHAIQYLKHVSDEHLRSEQWISKRQHAIEELKELEDCFIALANINASLPENNADVYLAVVEEMLLDADEKTCFDVDHNDDSIQEVYLLINLMNREISRAVSAIKSFDQRLIADAIAGNFYFDVSFVDFSVLEKYKIHV